MLVLNKLKIIHIIFGSVDFSFYICLSIKKLISMLLSDAKNLAFTLMGEHGLIENAWTFKFDNAKRRFGCCDYSAKCISLSKELVMLNTEERVKNTILHEIAHALVGRGHGHDWVWKTMAIQIGCNGERCYSNKDTVMVKGNYEATCPKCGHIHTKFRKPKRTSSCGECSNTFDKERILVFYQK